MKSLIHLYNTALSRLGGEQIPQNISSLESDTVGAICQNIFPHVLDVALEAHNWSFALKRAELAKVQGERSLFALPTDCVKPVRIWVENTLASDSTIKSRSIASEYMAESSHNTPEYVIEGSYISCHAQRVLLLYVARVTEPKMWSPSFSEYLVWLMAARLAPARNNDKQQQQMAEQMAETSLAKACARDRAKQRAHRPRSAWSTARGSNAYRSW